MKGRRVPGIASEGTSIYSSEHPQPSTERCQGLGPGEEAKLCKPKPMWKERTTPQSSSDRTRTPWCEPMPPPTMMHSFKDHRCSYRGNLCLYHLAGWIKCWQWLSESWPVLDLAGELFGGEGLCVTCSLELEIQVLNKYLLNSWIMSSGPVFISCLVYSLLKDLGSLGDICKNIKGQHLKSYVSRWKNCHSQVFRMHAGVLSCVAICNSCLLGFYFYKSLVPGDPIPYSIKPVLARNV